MRTTSITTYFIDLVKCWIELLWYTFGHYIIIAALVIAAISKSPWIYHPLLMLSLLAPGIFFVRYAFSNRSGDSKKWLKTLDNAGTLLTLLIAAFFIILYLACVYLKVR